MTGNVLHDKSLLFAVRIVNFYKHLSNNKSEFVLSKQTLRSGTSIGANIREARFAQSAADFVSKLSISLKEGEETAYWLELLHASGHIAKRDFDALRRKFVERWPGVFIPNIPHKKTVGSTDKGIVDLRIEQINRFLKKLSSIDYLYNSDEMELFLQNSDNIPKTLDNIKEDSYQEILKKYSQVFTDYDDNFDTIVGKNEQDEFYKQLNAMYPKLRAFRAFILGEKERFNLFQKNSNILMNMLCIYERDVVKVCVNDDENKLVFFNQKNDFNNIISNAQKKVINPYDKLYDSFTEDYLDTEAMIEALESLKNLQEIYNKLTKNLTSINVQLNDLQAGKTNVKSLLSFKNKEELISKLMLDKEKLEKDIDNLGLIIKIATFNMQNQIKNFKVICLENYYKELRLIERDTEYDAKIFDDLWENVVKDKNISEYN